MEEANNLTEGVGHALRPLTRDEKGRLDDLHDRAADLLDRIRELEAGR